MVGFFFFFFLWSYEHSPYLCLVTNISLSFLMNYVKERGSVICWNERHFLSLIRSQTAGVCAKEEIRWINLLHCTHKNSTQLLRTGYQGAYSLWYRHYWCCKVKEREFMQTVIKRGVSHQGLQVYSWRWYKERLMYIWQLLLLVVCQTTCSSPQVRCGGQQRTCVGRTDKVLASLCHLLLPALERAAFPCWACSACRNNSHSKHVAVPVWHWWQLGSLIPSVSCYMFSLAADQHWPCFPSLVDVFWL